MSEKAPLASEKEPLAPSAGDILFWVRDEWQRVEFDGRVIEGEEAWRAFLKSPSERERWAATEAIRAAYAEVSTP